MKTPNETEATPQQTTEATPHKSLIAGLRESLERVETYAAEGYGLSAALELHQLASATREAADKMGAAALKQSAELRDRSGSGTPPQNQTPKLP